MLGGSNPSPSADLRERGLTCDDDIHFRIMAEGGVVRLTPARSGPHRLPVYRPCTDVGVRRLAVVAALASTCGDSNVPIRPCRRPRDPDPRESNVRLLLLDFILLPLDSALLNEAEGHNHEDQDYESGIDRGNGRGRRTITRLRRELINIPARVIHPGHTTVLRLPPGPNLLATVLPRLQALPSG